MHSRGSFLSLSLRPLQFLFGFLLPEHLYDIVLSKIFKACRQDELVAILIAHCYFLVLAFALQSGRALEARNMDGFVLIHLFLE